MSGRFAESTQRLAGLVPRALGWRPSDFWTATPAELAAVLVPDGSGASAPLTRAEFNRLIESEHDGRSD